jgi:hypothetical protein
MYNIRDNSHPKTTADISTIYSSKKLIGSRRKCLSQKINVTIPNPYITHIARPLIKRALDRINVPMTKVFTAS